MIRMKRYIFSILLLSLFSLHIQAQDKNVEIIEGNVRLNDGQPADYVHVIFLNTNYGCVTDGNGDFHFKAPAGEYTMAVFSLTTKRKEFPVTIKAGIVNSFPDIIISEEKHYLNEVVVTGTRTARSLKDTPVLTKVISGFDIESSGATTALEALENFVPGVMFTPNAMGDNISIAGLDNKYILILVDGERLVNERTENVNFSRLNSSDIKRIEIVNGASSVLYGSNAIGAVINIITRDVEEPVQGNVRVRYSNYNSFVGDVSVGFKVGGFSSKTTLSSKSSDGYDSDRANVPTYFNLNPYVDYTIGEVLKYKFNEKFDAELKGNLYQNKVWLLQKYQIRYDKNYSLSGKLNYAFSPANVLTLSGSSDHYRGDLEYREADQPSEYANSSGYSAFRLIDVWDATKNIQLVSGAELNLESSYSINQFGIEPDERTANNWNLFAQGEFKTETGLEALVGMRYTQHSQFGGHLSPKISLMYKVDDFRFRTNISNGFKAPTIKELYMEFPHQIGGETQFWVIGNPDLVPEESWYKAISAEYLGSNINASITIHDNSIQNKIVTEERIHVMENEVRNEMRYENVEDAQITGVDLSVQWDFLKNFQLRGGYSFANAKDKTTGLQLVGNSRHNVTCNFTFKRPHLPFMSATKTPFSLMLSGRFMSSRVLARDIEYAADETTILNVDETISGNYYIVNFVYNQRFPIYKKLKGNFQFGINNLLNYVNYNTASGNPGRTFFASLGLSF